MTAFSPAWRTAAIVGAGVLACSGAAQQTTGEDQAQTVESGSSNTSPTGNAKPTKLVNHPPSFEIPAYRAVGIGQEIGFGIEVIDREQDDFRVEVLAKPASATYDPITLTVVWKPTRKDLPAGNFRVRITELDETGSSRAFEHSFSIDVQRRQVPLPSAGPLSPEVETLITIHDPARLADTNRRWPLDKILAHAARTHILDLPAEQQEQALAKLDSKELYRDVLRGLALANKNPKVHPDTGEFDPDTWGSAKSWKLIAVRPRLDKKWHELRLVYKNEASHAPTYLMFKFRPTSDTGLPAEARTYNNKLFSKLVAEAFLTVDGVLDPEFFSDKRRHSRRVAEFVSSVLEFRDDDKSWAHGTFLGLPCEARLGGGSKRTADGDYASGDGWAWNVMKAKIKDGTARFINVPIKGFATSVTARDGTWQMSCAKRFTDDGDPHLGGLCRDSGHVDLPAGGDGYREPEANEPVVSSLIDAANLFKEYKNDWMVERLPLRDPRRDLFEEKGMTCSQCHVRQFGVRDMRDTSAYDATAGAPTALNKDLATTFFVIVPTERWQPYAIDFQHKQQCKFKAALEEDLGIKSSLGCPLLANP